MWEGVDRYRDKAEYSGMCLYSPVITMVSDTFPGRNQWDRNQPTPMCSVTATASVKSAHKKCWVESIGIRFEPMILVVNGVVIGGYVADEQKPKKEKGEWVLIPV